MAEMKKQEIFDALRQVAAQNLLSEEEIRSQIEESIKKAFHSKFDPDAELELVMDSNANRFELINHSKYVVEDGEYQPEYRAIEIPLDQARKINPSVNIGDTVAEAVDFAYYSKMVAQPIRQMFTQGVKEKRKDATFAKHKSLKGEMVDVTVITVTDSYAIFNLEDGTTAFMPAKLRNPNIKLSVGQKTKVYVEDVLPESKDAQIIVSNGSKDVVKRVLEFEVPEIQDGTVEIVAISRIPGLRSKVAVKSTNPNVDPVGAIIGAQGQRINAIVNKLSGEKLDIIPWNYDENVFVAAALSPAKIVSILDKKDANGEPVKGYKIAIAPNKHQTLAIGKQGSNVKLAVELTNVRIDVISVDEARKRDLDIEWNVGFTEADLIQLENGLDNNRNRRPMMNRNNNTPYTPRPARIEVNLDDQIESFNTSMESKQDEKVVEDFEIDENLFTEEQLRQMEADFEFDDEITEYPDDENGDEEHFE